MESFLLRFVSMCSIGCKSRLVEAGKKVQGSFMEKYTYSAEDKSLMTPFVYTFFVNPLMRILPRSIPANIITLLSNNFVTVSFLIAYINYQHGTNSFLWLIPILCFAYIVGDCSDGIQARRTKTSSPLGEYFDHFLDSFVTGLLTGTLMLAFRVTNPILLFCTYQFLYLGQVGSFWQRLYAGIIKFAKFSTSEGVMAIALMAAIYPIKYIYEANQKVIIFGFSTPQIIIFTAFFAAGVTGISSIAETKRCSIRLCLHVLFSAFVGAVLIWFVHASILLLTMIIMLYNVFFIESLLAATANKQKESFPDFVVPISCVLYFLLPQYTHLLLILQVGYLALRVIIRFAIFFVAYKQYWHWVNPKIDESAEK